MAALPSLLRDLASQWDLTTNGGLLGRGYNAVVLPVRQDGRPLALKLTWPPGRARKEADALAAWRARGAVGRAACDAPRGALLLERLDASRSLAAIPVAEAAAAAGTLIRTLAIAPSRSFPSLRAHARQLAATIPARQRSLQDPLPGPWITLAARLAAARRGTQPGLSRSRPQRKRTSGHERPIRRPNPACHHPREVTER